ncbi:hypothetical protein D1007_53998 [Hordeum vulgare]|nr:hypothetical protein D1007_53998 [Hordeum vulgare]
MGMLEAQLQDAQATLLVAKEELAMLQVKSKKPLTLCRPRTWLLFPDFLAEDMEELAPLGVWLQSYGCCNGPNSVATEFNSLGFLFVRCGWNSFALAQGLRDGYVLHFKFYGASMLFVKAFRGASGPLDWCTKDSRSG